CTREGGPYWYFDVW
nr:immunoglobulin heavy chain junction region [Mus musculus]MBK4197052.1 immunoglobulin heavy chain junction region [Mus musculus]MBK4197054.1 immunoglobulin heavy chain junction region [Mus musculus]